MKILMLVSQTLNYKPSTLNPRPEPFHLKPYTLINHKPLNPKPQTPHPKPETLNP